MCVLIVKNPRNLDAYQIIKISLVLYNNYIILKDQEKFVFYINNFIN